MAEIDRQQASRQKQAPEKQPERAPQSRAAPQTAAAFLQALLAGAGVEQIPLQTAEQIAGQIGNSALAALAAVAISAAAAAPITRLLRIRPVFICPAS